MKPKRMRKNKLTKSIYNATNQDIGVSMQKIMMHKLLLAKSSVITLYLLIASWLLFIVFHTQSLDGTTLITSYSTILFALIILSKISNSLIKE